jgi:hypothetical protein
MSAFPEAPATLAEELAPAFFSKTFQNFKLSSAAKNESVGTIYEEGYDLPAVANICPSGLKQLWRTRVS